MGIGWEWERNQKEEGRRKKEEGRGKREEERGKKEDVKASDSPQFLLVKQRRDAPEIAAGTLDKTLSQLERPLDLWLVNFRVPVNLEAQKCQVESGELPAVDGYEYQVYHCS